MKKILILLAILAQSLSFLKAQSIQAGADNTDKVNQAPQLQDMSFLKTKPDFQVSESAPVVSSEGLFDNLELARQSPEKVLRLNLQNSGLKTMPPDLSKFVNLRELDLSHNQITRVSDDIKLPASLTALYINNNQITELPASFFSRFSGLEVLIAKNNPISKIDASIGSLTKLKHLELSGNGEIASFQPAIWSLNNLEELRLWSFGITEVPEAISALQKLHTLCLMDNQLQLLHPNVVALPELRYLSLGRNKLVALPYQIVDCQKLNYLSVFENPITILPDKFDALSITLKWFLAWDTPVAKYTQSYLTKKFPNTSLRLEKKDVR